MFQLWSLRRRKEDSRARTVRWLLATRSGRCLLIRLSDLRKTAQKTSSGWGRRRARRTLWRALVNPKLSRTEHLLDIHPALVLVSHRLPPLRQPISYDAVIPACYPHPRLAVHPSSFLGQPPLLEIHRATGGVFPSATLLTTPSSSHLRTLSFMSPTIGVSGSRAHHHVKWSNAQPSACCSVVSRRRSRTRTTFPRTSPPTTRHAHDCPSGTPNTPRQKHASRHSSSPGRGRGHLNVLHPDVQTVLWPSRPLLLQPLE